MNVSECPLPVAKPSPFVPSPGAEPVVLVVMENASAWPPHLQGGVASSVVLRQEEDEDAASLLRRTYSRIRTVERAGGSIESAVLCCNDDASVNALESRVPLARALLATVLRSAAGELELSARFGAPHRTKQSLLGLAGTLTAALVGSSGSVSARFFAAPSSEKAIGRHGRTASNKA